MNKAENPETKVNKTNMSIVKNHPVVVKLAGVKGIPGPKAALKIKTIAPKKPIFLALSN